MASDPKATTPTKSSAGYLNWRWLGDAKYRSIMMYPGIAFLIFIPLCYLAPIWPFWLAAELAAVAVGVTAGWCGLDSKRMKVATVKQGDELDKMGFFNARVAMRNPDLFRISIADIDMHPAQRAVAIDLVENYWGSNAQVPSGPVHEPIEGPQPGEGTEVNKEKPAP